MSTIKVQVGSERAAPDRITIEAHGAFGIGKREFTDPRHAAEHLAHLEGHPEAPIAFVLNDIGNRRKWTKGGLLALVAEDQREAA